MVGTFYAAPAPGEPAFVQVGDEVAANQTLCIVEAMKLMNEIGAEEMGTVTQLIDTLLTLRPDAPGTASADTQALSE